MKYALPLAVAAGLVLLSGQHAMAFAEDTYRDYADLAAHETEGTDYRIGARTPAGAETAHIAVHGGAIEPGTTQLADYAGSAAGHAYYSFEGIKPSGNGRLHLTSTHFDEPRAVRLVGGTTRTVSWHGAAGDQAKTYVGGRDKALKSQVTERLRAAGFTIASGTPPELDASNPDNITNRNARGKGVQLELTTAQRARFFKDGRLGRAWIEDPAHRTDAFYSYAKAVNRALAP